MVHPRQTDAVLQRAIFPVTDPGLHRFVEHFWSVRWDRPGAAPAESEVITSPYCHLTFEDGHDAEGAPLVRQGMRLPAAVVTTVRLSGRIHEPGDDYLQTAAIIELIERDSAVVQVEQIGPRVGMSTRNVQRLFKFYLGVPPKWVLMRSRLQDAAAALDADPATDLSAVAFRFGWYDQPHFVRDFRRFLGITPGQYARDAAGRS